MLPVFDCRPNYGCVAALQTYLSAQVDNPERMTRTGFRTIDERARRFGGEFDVILGLMERSCRDPAGLLLRDGLRFARAAERRGARGDRADPAGLAVDLDRNVDALRVGSEPADRFQGFCAKMRDVVGRWIGVDPFD